MILLPEQTGRFPMVVLAEQPGFTRRIRDGTADRRSGSRSQVYDLTDTKLASSDNCPINARMVVVHAYHSLHYLGVCFGRVRVEIDHHTTLVPYGNADGRTSPFG